MLHHLRQLAIFAKTIDHGSFRGAAQALDLSPSVVSHHISQLEEQLGVALLYRSTRKLALTRDGELLLEAARKMIDAAEDGLQTVVETARVPSGELRVTLPAILAQSQLVSRISDFSRAHPNVRLYLDFSDARKDIIDDGYDVAIRMGWLKDSSLIAKKMYDVPRLLIASSDSLRHQAAPKSPHDLTDWRWIMLSHVEGRRPKFSHPDLGTHVLRPTAKILVNDAHALYSLCRAGAGLAIVPDFSCQSGLKSGEITHVLPNWSVDPVGVYAVRPANAPKHGLSRFFINAISGAALPRKPA